MASRSPAPSLKPKHKGGAQKARERKQRLATERAARDAVDGNEHPTAKYVRLGPAPTEGIENIAYANKVTAMMLHDVLTDRGIESETLRLKLALECVRSIGMTGVKALYEQRLKNLEARVYGKGASDEDGDGLEDEKP